jgi:hypothetical protein
MFEPPEEVENDGEVLEEKDDSAGWEDDWERMQESAVVEKRKQKTLKRLKARGDY